MDSLTPADFAREARAASQDRIAAHAIGGAVCLQTGQAYIDGDEVNVYIGGDGGGSVSLTDLGETMQRASAFLDPSDPLGGLAAQLASRFGCDLANGEIHCRCPRGEAAARALSLARCAAALEAALAGAAFARIEDRADQLSRERHPTCTHSI